MDETVTVEREGAVTTVVLHRPQARNAVDGPTAQALADEFRAFDADEDGKLTRKEIEVERQEIATNSPAEEAELAGLYVDRGLTPELARAVAAQVHADPELAVAVHARGREVAIFPIQPGGFVDRRPAVGGERRAHSGMKRRHDRRGVGSEVEMTE